MKYLQKILSVVLALVILFQCGFAGAVKASADETEVRVTTGTHYAPESDATDEELFAGYALQMFYGSNMSFFGSAAGEMLTGDEKILYDALVPCIRQIANGERASATIAVGQTVTASDGVTYAADVEAVFSGTTITNSMFNRVVNALLADLPYEMYWFDKASGCGMYTIGGLIQVGMQFTVASNYRGADAYTADTAKTGVAKAAATNAQNIIDKYASVSDYEKLVGYKNEICELVEYDYDAAAGGYFTTDIDPWQLISVFDGDSSTNVVCEGYSKAFMYLCDMTDFSGDVACYTVTGYMDDENHMWNVVEIEGKHYLVDVTNSDTDTVGNDGSLFLAGAAGSAVSGYTLAGAFYAYDSDTLSLWGTDENSILTLEVTGYEPEAEGEDEIISGTCGENLTWTLADGVLTISGTGAMDNYWKNLPPWNHLLKEIQTLEILDGVTSVGESSFQGCSMSLVKLPDSLSNIRWGAFANCDNLISVTIPKCVKFIEVSAFNGCDNMQSIIFLGDAPEIEDLAFVDVEATAYYPADNSTWTEDVMQNYSGNITWSVIGSDIGNEGGDNTEGETGDGTGTGSGSESDSGDGEGTGSGTGSGEGTSSGSGTGTGEGAGEGSGSSSGSGSVSGEGSGGGTEGGAGSNNGANDENGEINWKFENGILTISGEGPMPSYLNSKRPWQDIIGEVTKVIIEDGITSIGEDAFVYCHSLVDVELPDSLESLGNYAFSNCSQLSEISFGENLKSIGQGALRYCENLRQITFSGDAPIINREVFFADTATVYYPFGNPTWTADVMWDYGGDITWLGIDENGEIVEDNTGTEPDSGYYSGICGANVTWELKDCILTISGSGEMYDYGYYQGTESPWYQHAEKIKMVIIEDGVTNVGTCAFYECTALQEVQLSESIITIDPWSFYGCTSLEKVNLPDSLSVIGSRAFRGCSSLNQVLIPASVIEIGDKAFKRCLKLTIQVDNGNSRYYVDGDGVLIDDVEKALIFYPQNNPSTSYVVPEGIIIIGSHLFDSCTLREIRLPESVTTINEGSFESCYYLTEINLPDSVETIGDGAFYDCRSLEEVVLPQGLTRIGVAAFEYCTSIGRIVIPNQVENIPYACFSSCAHLNEVVIVGDVTAVGNSAFLGCSEIERIVFMGNAPTFDQSAFAYVNTAIDVYYPANNPTWTNDIMQSYGGEVNGGSVTWKPYCTSSHMEATIPGKAATCTESGLTDGKKCSFCGTVTVAQKTVAATGHTYSNDMDTTCNVCGDVRQNKVATTPMYRLYNPNSGEHFYTGSVEEKDNLVVAGWQYEGVAWNAPTNAGAPVYRLYNPNSGDHHYTMSAEERDNLVAVGWQYEGVAWNSAPVTHPEALPLYRLYNPNADCGSHHYTGSTEERDMLVGVGWIYEGIGWSGMLR